MTKVNTQKAVITSLVGAGIITLIYWLITKLLSVIPIWAVFVLVFAVSLICMKWKDWF